MTTSKHTPTQALDLALLLRMTRPGFLSITAVGCLLGLASAAACACGIDPLRAIATLVLALAAHAGANVLNDYHDALNGADAGNRDGIFPFTGGSRLLQQGQVSLEQTRQLAWLLLGLVALAGILLAVHTGGGLLLIGLAGLLLGWAYSAPPLKLMCRGLGELAVALTWWLIVIGADYVQRRAFLVIPAATALSYALLVANILLVNGYPDARSDAAAGKRTLVVKLGPARAAWLYFALALLAHGWLAVGAWQLLQPMAALWGLTSLPLSLAAGWLLWQRAYKPEQLRPVIVLTIGAALLHGLGMAAGLAAMGWH